MKRRLFDKTNDRNWHSHWYYNFRHLTSEHVTQIPEINLCALSSMSVEARLRFSPLRPPTCTHIRCNCSVSLRFRQTAVRGCANGVSRPVHSEPCCQGIRRKQVGNVPAAGRSRAGAEMVVLKKRTEIVSNWE